jgi:transposase
MAVADRSGLPLAVGIASGERHEVKLVEDTLDACFLDELPPKLIGDMAYDANELDARLMEERNVELIAPHNPTRKRKTQDGRPLRRYRRRWMIERVFAWLQNFRRLLTRHERKPGNFLGFVQLGCAVILLRAL